MSAHEQVALTTRENQAFALMSRLHVILRRQNGRIIDIEYMRIDPAYCRYVLDLATRDGSEELRAICAKLHESFFGSEGLFTRASPRPPLTAKLMAQAKPAPQAEPPAPSAGAPAPDVEQAYIGRLR